jgi:uncharacterized protein (TIGR03083 family)
VTAPAQGEWPSLLDAATTSVAALVAAVPPGCDWEETVPGLTWSRRDVLEHVADNFVWYAALLVRGRPEGHPPFAVRLEGDLDADAVVDTLTSLSRVLGAAVQAAPAGALGWHPYGSAGPRDYAAMGALEAMVHGDDLRRSFGVPWTPPPAPVVGVLVLLFGVDDAGPDPWARLLDLCGRSGGPVDWRWHNTGT